MRLLRGVLVACRGGNLEHGLRDLTELIADVGGGRIGPAEVRGNQVFVPLAARDGEWYILRLIVERYLAEPLRCTFVDEHHRETPTAWPYPEAAGPFRSPSFICTPPTAEFYHYHPEREYDRRDGTLANTVATVFTALNLPTYRGRYRDSRRGRAR